MPCLACELLLVFNFVHAAEVSVCEWRDYTTVWLVKCLIYYEPMGAESMDWFEQVKINACSVVAWQRHEVFICVHKYIHAKVTHACQDFTRFGCARALLGTIRSSCGSGWKVEKQKTDAMTCVTRSVGGWR